MSSNQDKKREKILHFLVENLVERAKRNCGYKSYKKKNVSRREEKQENVAICCSKLLYKKLYAKKSCLTNDDETYCGAYFRSFPGHQYYSANNRKKLNSKYKCIRMKKFAKKFLVWQAICECVERSSYFVIKGTISTKIYIRECLKKHLLPILRSYTDNPLFWPNLALCHYNETTLNWLREHKVDFFEKHCNAPNCPELPPIERYWAMVEGKLRFNVKEAKNIQDFKSKWIRATKKVQPKTVQKLMLSVKCKVRAFSCTQLHKLT